jgi:hypothetical protein
LTYKIINNLLTHEQEDLLESSVLNGNTQWIFNRFTAYKHSAYGVSDELKRNINSFRHAVFQNGKMLDRDMFDLFKIIPEKLGAKEIHNMICQLQLVTVGGHTPIKHVDLPNHLSPYYSAVYYINDSDGPTVLYNEDDSELIRCEHQKGKTIMFDGNIFHHASKPSKEIRCVMNFCFV